MVTKGAVLCGGACVPLCDFCKHFEFNGEKELIDGREITVYVGNGRCALHNRSQHPHHDCDDFHCENA